tara:strand:+ start:361 stop:1275 length:915 start_codon:yes stop_codon:yes gene_type:complete
LKINLLYKGIFYTSIASIFWGLPQPVYFNEIKFVPSIEVVCHRAIWSFIFLFIITLYFKKINEFFIIFLSYDKIFFLSVTAFLITINWNSFIFAISINRLQDASMGYFISPIISIALGYIFLNEKISKLKLVSLFLMIFSILFLLISLKTIPYLAIVIALSWAFYGLIRKKVNISSEIGLLYECGFISIFAIMYLIYLQINNEGYFLNYSYYISLLLFFIGAITIFPLFFFNLGVKAVPLGLAGVIFYLAPTFHFITSVFIFEEELIFYKLISFIIIWIAVAIFIYDKITEDKKIIENNTQLLN